MMRRCGALNHAVPEPMRQRSSPFAQNPLPLAPQFTVAE
jgi:hypothetical protein